MTPRLHIGDKNYSSWSMRPWLALKHGGIAFEEVLHALPEVGGAKPVFDAISPTGRVPALEVDGIVIAESLAICEWAAEREVALWPRDPASRALARSAATMMHAGFAGLRAEAPMNIRRRTDSNQMTQAGLNDAAKVDELWCGWLKRSGGPFLFGQYSVADAMYAPVATRFVTYAIQRSPEASGYIERMLAEPHLAAWISAAEKETRQLPRSDIA